MSLHVKHISRALALQIQALILEERILKIFGGYCIQLWASLFKKDIDIQS